ncbi:Cyclin-dependent kinase 2-interacting protein [Lamellibrachia satsuma]|nr:Cyclin-dependent kinase 2-interacting protein [Lamellibrachia satsuma]
MQKLTEAFHGIVELERHRNEGPEQEPMFLSWTTDMFYETSEKLLQMYREELPSKEVVVQNIAHGTSRDITMFYTATWKHEPYIDWPKATLLLESMLTETGHR